MVCPADSILDHLHRALPGEKEQSPTGDIQSGIAALTPLATTVKPGK